MGEWNLCSIVRVRVRHSGQFVRNKLTCISRELADLVWWQSSPLRYSVIDGNGHTFHFGSLKNSLRSADSLVYLFGCKICDNIINMKFENLTVERCTGNENARTFANWVNVVPDWLFAWAMIFGYAVRASVTLWLIRTAVWKVVRVAHRPWNTSVAYKSSRAPISCL